MGMFSLEREFYESGSQGNIMSPNYPSSYGLNLNYYWRITVASGYRIQLRFEDFELEDDQFCRKDFIKVYDGSGPRDDLLETYCGRTRPESIKSSGRYLYIHFRSDSDTTRKGFRIYWFAFRDVTTTTTTTTTTPATPEGTYLFFLLSAKEGEISSK